MGIILKDEKLTVAQVNALLSSSNLDALPALLEYFKETDMRKGVQQACTRAESRIKAHKQEVERVTALYDYQDEVSAGEIVVGVDEVGRGALAGPLTVAAVALPREPLILGLDDSKALTAVKREEVAEQIKQHALALGIAHIPPWEIDEKGLVSSLKAAMNRAIQDIGLTFDSVLIDGNPIGAHPQEQCIVHGDSLVACIAAASIIAKVTRDQIMVEMEEVYPGYSFAKSKGYGSREHIQAIEDLGLTDQHRKSFCSRFI